MNGVSNEGDLIVTLEVDSPRGTNIEFLLNKIVVARFAEVDMNFCRFSGRIMNYELEPRAGKYLYIYRDMNGNVSGQTVGAIFYLANRPFALKNTLRSSSTLNRFTISDRDEQLQSTLRFHFKWIKFTCFRILLNEGPGSLSEQYHLH